MSDYMNAQKVVLFGVGKMGLEYTKVLQALGAEYSVVGRSEAGVKRFADEAGVRAMSGGYTAWENAGGVANTAIVAVSVEELAETTISLMESGVRNILLEKPGGIDAAEIRRAAEVAKDTGSRIVIAYNRRFYSSLLKAQEMIAEDGGVESFHFEFTEWPHNILDSITNKRVLANWFLANSSHVADMAFFLGGWPKEMACYTSGSIDWHPSASVFSGAGVTDSGALFSYQADWQAPGRWSIEMITRNRRLIFRPMEKLQVQLNRSVAVDFVDIDDSLDRDFKPGLYRQVKAFLEGDHHNFIYLDEHYKHVVDIFEKIVRPSGRY